MVKKKVKKSSLKHHAHYIAIVAVVAVVGIVFLILNFTDRNVIGEASRLSKISAETSVCYEGKKCGFMTKEEFITGVINVLNKCTVFQLDPRFKPNDFTCNDRCNEVNKQCVLSNRVQVDTDLADRVAGLVACNSPIDKTAVSILYDCYCC